MPFLNECSDFDGIGLILKPFKRALISFFNFFIFDAVEEEIFRSQGHCGFHAPHCIDIFRRLLTGFWVFCGSSGMARLEDRLTNIEMDVIDVESEAVTSATGEDVCVVFVRW